MTTLIKRTNEEVMKKMKEIKGILNRLLKAQIDDQNQRALERIKAKNKERAYKEAKEKMEADAVIEALDELAERTERVG